MVLKILAEVALFVITFAAGSIWWQLRKRRAFVRKIVKDELLLKRVISNHALANPPAQILPYTKKNEIGYFVNIDVVLRADQTSQRIPRLLVTVVLVFVLVGSYLLANTYLWINLGIFLLVGLVPIMDSARHNAEEHVLTLGVILHKWRTENAPECDAFVAQAHSLEKLYDTVKIAGGPMNESELVFAYGSNMEPAQMRERCPVSDLSWFLAKAEGWKLCFPRESAKRKGGVGSLEQKPGRDVWGVVFSVSQRDLRRLDQFEGVTSKSYQRDRIEVVDKDGNRLQVWTYFATPQDKPVREYLPHKEYIRLYIQGAEYFGLPEGYVRELREIKTKDTDD